MDPARSWPNGVSHIFKKSNDVVIRPLFNLRDFRDGEPRPFPNFGRVFLRNLAKFRHCLAGKDLDLQPNLKLSFVRPNLTHLWPGIAINHCGNIKASSSREKRFVSSTRGSGGVMLKNQKRQNTAALQNVAASSTSNMRLICACVFGVRAV